MGLDVVAPGASEQLGLGTRTVNANANGDDVMAGCMKCAQACLERWCRGTGRGRGVYQSIVLAERSSSIHVRVERCRETMREHLEAGLVVLCRRSWSGISDLGRRPTGSSPGCRAVQGSKTIPSRILFTSSPCCVHIAATFSSYDLPSLRLQYISFVRVAKGPLHLPTPGHPCPNNVFPRRYRWIAAKRCVEPHAIMSFTCHDLTSHEHGMANAAQCFNGSREWAHIAESQSRRLRCREGRPPISKASRSRTRQRR